MIPVLSALFQSRAGHYAHYGLIMALAGAIPTALAATDGAVKIPSDQHPKAELPQAVAPQMQAQAPAPSSISQPEALQRTRHGSHQASNRLVIPLPADETIGRQDVDYLCSIDEKKASDEVRSLRTSLPEGRFTATYLSADIMALVVLPLDGRVMVFANVVAGDGAKYVGDRYSWWAKGDDVTFAREDKNGVSISCHVAPPAQSQPQPQQGHSKSK